VEGTDIMSDTTGRQTTWAPIETHPTDRYILLCDKICPNWDGNMEVGRWWGNKPGEKRTGWPPDDTGCFWSTGGPNGGTEISYHRRDDHEGINDPYAAQCGHINSFTHWMDLPENPA
jgi:hypothetical protein